MAEIDRRSMMGASLAVIATAYSRRACAQEMLDPTIIGKPRAGGDALLDPATAGVARIESDNAPLRPNNHYDPGYARSMNVSVADAVITLLHACANSSTSAKSKETDCNTLNAQLGGARQNKFAKLDEYRQGMFCSGCGQTRSEILAKGEQFPHSGQTAIPATPQQIAAKELQLDKEIDLIAERLDRTTNAYKEKDEEASEATDQLAYGMQLWRLAVSFENNLIKQTAMDVLTPAESDFSKAGAQIQRIKLASPLRPSPNQFAQLEGDLRLWSNIRETAASRANKAVEDCRARLDASMIASRTTRDLLLKSGRALVPSMTDRTRANLIENQLLTLAGGDYLMSPNPSVGSMRLFRMGSYVPAQKGTIIPAVKTFVDRSQQTPGNYNGLNPVSYYPSERAELATWLNIRRPEPVATAPAGS